MTIDKAKLKALAQAVADLEDIPEREDEHAEAVDALWLNIHCHTILALLAEIDRLSPPAGQVSYRQQMEAWKSASSQDLRARGELMIQVDELKAENEALRKDAERYRAIRDEIPHVDLGRAILDVQTADEYDSAVDAAMAKEASHG
ncbi:hypothetical protein DN388_15975 [Pseudomonas sp. S12(2018)]|uniref:hypothetical protein n=1 Tax=Pseudomonas sp. S12(2018) TaxID=2219664 RepID=UPI0020CDD37E|nr:hypothetical protein [Pseudomonas sp. S12(2018)]MCQ0168455.1 hypothetical protein [Pseudomonas sp. S12(2018)]